ncbi:RNA polymerase sigma factor [Gracilibacillus oryzae]|uniref:RNA polymerase sigma factor n=1 Tax=Gracilibacillus oryzae TaxID=1672701 RepID=A0A7C8KUH3_9BACI|nr:RNA polymerase sigma factor [Gracilibacillus oryzae]KAB8137483.1 RNA polymerase sigma factor [Gracilibacillus oryzae]
MTQSSISQLMLTKAEKGELEIFKDIYEDNKKHVFVIALSILKDVELSEDIMQEVFIKLYQLLKEKEVSNLKAWLIRVSRNTALDVYRKRKHEITGFEESYFDRANYCTDSPVERMVLTKSLNTLEMDERQIVFLKDISGMKHREIAKLLEMPLGTVLWKYRKALNKLKNSLEEVE